MKILVLSDLNWHILSKKIGKNDLIYLNETNRRSTGGKFYSINQYWDIITKIKPDILFFAGDVTGDGSCGHGFYGAFSYLLSLLEMADIATCYIQGDNDLEDYYAIVKNMFSNSKTIYEISNRIINIKGIKIFGLPFQASNNKKDLNLILPQLEEHKVDIILCHSPLKRRTHLIGETKVKTIITGHFDNKLCKINNKNFVSLSNDSHVINYVIIDNPTKSSFSYHFHDTRKRLDISYKTDLVAEEDSIRQLYLNNIPSSIEEYEDMDLPYNNYEKEKNALGLAIKYLRGQDYSLAIEWLLALDKDAEPDKDKLTKMMRRRITSKHTLSKTMVTDYLGSKAWRFFKKKKKKSGE